LVSLLPSSIPSRRISPAGLVALTDGFRESHESWADLLRDCRRRGMRAPILAIGDGALGFWKTLREVFPRGGPRLAQSRRGVSAASGGDSRPYRPRSAEVPATGKMPLAQVFSPVSLTVSAVRARRRA
jgi:hypothetical protein